MKLIPLTRGMFAKVDDCHYERILAMGRYNEAARFYFGEFAYQNDLGVIGDSPTPDVNEVSSTSKTVRRVAKTLKTWLASRLRNWKQNVEKTALQRMTLTGYLTVNFKDMNTIVSTNGGVTWQL